MRFSRRPEALARLAFEAVIVGINSPLDIGQNGDAVLVVNPILSNDTQGDILIVDPPANAPAGTTIAATGKPLLERAAR